LQIKTKIVSCHTADSKPVKQEVNGTVILPPLVFPGLTFESNTIRSSTNEGSALTHKYYTIVKTLAGDKHGPVFLVSVPLVRLLLSFRLAANVT